MNFTAFVGVTLHDASSVRPGQHALDDFLVLHQRQRRLAGALQAGLVVASVARVGFGSGIGSPRLLFEPSAAGPMSFE